MTAFRQITRLIILWIEWAIVIADESDSSIYSSGLQTEILSTFLKKNTDTGTGILKIQPFKKIHLLLLWLAWTVCNKLYHILK